jgi:tetratricopeptide (TPR) repeat protein
MKLFISYPHQPQNHARLAERIIERLRLEPDVEEVWFDKDHLLAGDDWPQEIVDGILSSDWTIGFLSNYSVRDPGVCLNELSLAAWNKGGASLVAVQLERLERLPISVSHVQTLFLDDVPPHAEPSKQWFDKKFAELIAAIHSTEGKRRTVELDTVRAVLGSGGDYFEQRINRYIRGYVGRKWLFDAVEKWARESTLATNERPLFVLVGAPGIGKSAWASNLTLRSKTRVVGFYFVERTAERASLADRIVRTFIRQMAFNMADFRRVLLQRLGLPTSDGVPSSEDIVEIRKRLSGLSPAQLFQQFGIEVAEQSVNRQEKLLIVLDGIDEAASYNNATDTWDTSAIQSLLTVFEQLPPWLGVVVTSRPERHLEQLLNSHAAVKLSADDERNIGDLESWLGKHSMLASQPSAAAVARSLGEKAAGNFRYAEIALRALYHKQQFDIDTIKSLPPALNQMYLVLFRWQFQNLTLYQSTIAPALGQALGSPIPLPLQWLARWQGWTKMQQAQFMRHVGSLLEVVDLPDIGVALRPYHDTVKEWIESAAAGEFMLDMPLYRAELATKVWHDDSFGLDQPATNQQPSKSSHVIHAIDMQAELLLGSSRDALGPGDVVACGIRLKLAYEGVTFRNWFRMPRWVIRMMIENHVVLSAWPQCASLLRAFGSRLPDMAERAKAGKNSIQQKCILLGCQWYAQLYGRGSITHAHTVAVLLREYLRTGHIRDAMHLAVYLEPLVLDRSFASPEDSDALSTIAAAVGEAYLDNHQPERAATFSRINLAMSQQLKGSEDADTARAKNNLAVGLQATGQTRSAKELYKEALGVLKRTLPADHKDTITTLSNLAIGEDSSVDLAELETDLREAIRVSEQTGNTRGSAHAAGCLGVLREKRGDLKEARSLLERSVAICENLEEADPLLHAQMLNSLGRVLKGMKNYQSAVRALRLASDMLEVEYGQDHPGVANYVLNLAITLGENKSFEMAIRECRRALQMMERTYGQNGFEVGRALASLGGLLLDGNHPSEAKAAYSRAIKILESVGSSPELEIDVLRELRAKCESRPGRPAKRGTGRKRSRRA